MTESKEQSNGKPLDSVYGFENVMCNFRMRLNGVDVKYEFFELCTEERSREKLMAAIEDAVSIIKNLDLTFEESIMFLDCVQKKIAERKI